MLRRTRRPPRVATLSFVLGCACSVATIVLACADSTADAKASNGKFNLHTLRGLIANYQAQHNGLLPSADLSELLVRTDATGAKMPAGGTVANYPYGPYLRTLPTNPFTNSLTVKSITNDPAAAGDVTTTHGWLYNTTTGGIWINDAKRYVD